MYHLRRRLGSIVVHIDIEFPIAVRQVDAYRRWIGESLHFLKLTLNRKALVSCASTRCHKSGWGNHTFCNAPFHVIAIGITPALARTSKTLHDLLCVAEFLELRTVHMFCRCCRSSPLNTRPCCQQPAAACTEDTPSARAPIIEVVIRMFETREEKVVGGLTKNKTIM